jgi:hypothetical protein
MNDRVLLCGSEADRFDTEFHLWSVHRLDKPGRCTKRVKPSDGKQTVFMQRNFGKSRSTQLGALI